MGSLLAPWYSLGRKVEHEIEEFFGRLGHSVARHPVRYILGVLFTVLVCSAGFLRFKPENEGDKLWVPQDSKAKQDEDYISSRFDGDYRGGSVLFVATSATGKDVIDLDVMEDIWDAYEVVFEQTKANGKSFSELCAITDFDGDCVVFGMTQFFNNNRTYYNQVVATREDLISEISATRYPSGQEVNQDQIFGKYTQNATTGEITSAKGTLLFFQIDGSPLSRALKWEESFLNKVDGVKPQYSKVYYFADRSFNDELAASVAGDIGLMVITYTLMISFTCTVLAKGYNVVQTRVGLSVAGIMIILLAIVTGYGLSSGLGVIFVSIHQVLPFIIVGIGVDDLLIIVSAFDSTDERLSSENRLALALRRCGVSITYTTLTDVSAFFLGATSALPAIQAFCIYAAFAILFNFLFQCTMFTALMVYDTERMNSFKMDVLCCCQCIPPAAATAADSVSAPAWTQTSTSDAPSSSRTLAPAATRGDQLGEDQLPAETPKLTPTSSSQSPKQWLKSLITPRSMSPSMTLHGSRALGRSKTRLQYFFGEVYWPQLCKPWVRMAIILLFAGILAVNIYGVTQVNQGFDVIDLVPDDSYVRDYVTEARDLNVFIFEENTPVDIAYKSMDYHDQDVQEGMLELEDDFLSLKGGFTEGPVTSWIRSFTTWVQSDTSPYNTSVNADGYLVNETLFYEAVLHFTQLELYTRFDTDVVFHNVTINGVPSLRIRNSRVSAYHVGLGDPLDEIDAMLDSRDLMKKADLPRTPIVFSPTYVNIETELVLPEELTLNLAFALVAVTIVSLLILVRPTAVLLVSMIICVIDVEIIGTMYFWGLNVNTVTVVQLVMAVGLVVDYTAHILHYYLQQPFHKEPMERLRDALVEIGPSVLLGCFTTFLGVMPLAFAQSVIFRTFFRMFLSIIVYGAAHGLIFLPAIIPSLPFGDVSEYVDPEKSVKRKTDQEEQGRGVELTGSPI